MVTSGQSVHPTTLFSWASLTKQLTRTLYTFCHCVLVGRVGLGEAGDVSGSHYGAKWLEG